MAKNNMIFTVKISTWQAFKLRLAGRSGKAISETEVIELAKELRRLIDNKEIEHLGER